MKAKELKQLNKESLENKLNELKKELVKLNAQRSTGTTLESPKQIRTIKRTIAQIQTLLKNKKEEKEQKK